MALFSALTGGPLRRAYSGVMERSSQMHPANVRAIHGGYDQGQAHLIQGTDAAIHTLQGGRDAAGQVLRGYHTEAQNALGQGLDRAGGLYDMARGSFVDAGNQFAPVEQLAGRYGQMTNLYQDALGARGSEGLQRARDAFGNSLASNFEMEQGLDAINRARNARGGGSIGGGNVDRDAMLFGQNLANSRTGQYLDRLQGFMPYESQAVQTAATGRANALGQIGGLYGSEAGMNYGYGQDLANLANTTGGRISDLTMGTSGAVANLQSNRAANLANMSTGRASDLVGLNLNLRDTLNNAQIGRGQATMQGSANALNFGSNLLGMGLGFLGKLF